MKSGLFMQLASLTVPGTINLQVVYMYIKLNTLAASGRLGGQGGMSHDIQRSASAPVIWSENSRIHMAAVSILYHRHHVGAISQIEESTTRP